METIGFIGGGNMAEALIKGIITAGLYGPPNIYVSDIKTDRLNYLAGTYKITAVADNKSMPAQVKTLVLSVKPQNLSEVLEQIKPAVSEQMLIISLAAGKNIAEEVQRYADLSRKLSLEDRKLFWQGIWDLSNDPNKLHELGIRAVNGKVTYKKLQPGLIYVFRITATGDLYAETVHDL